jgi:hypothetical protein
MPEDVLAAFSYLMSGGEREGVAAISVGKKSAGARFQEDRQEVPRRLPGVVEDTLTSGGNMKSWKLGLTLGLVVGALSGGMAMGGPQSLNDSHCVGCNTNWQRCMSRCNGNTSCQALCAEDYDNCMSLCSYDYPARP